MWCGVVDVANQTRAVLSAGPYHDTSVEGKYYAVVLEQIKDPNGQVSGRDSVASNPGLG